MQTLKNKQSGFTIVELVIVMVVIGILSAVALPRMVNLAKEARKNTYLTVANNLYTSIELLRNQWYAMSEPNVITTTDGIDIFMARPLGIPTNVGNVRVNPPTPDDCLNLWNALLKNPPLASTAAGCSVNGTCKYELLVDQFSGDESSMDCYLTDKDGNTINYYYSMDPTSSEVSVYLNDYDRSNGEVNFVRKL